jgi:sortase A
MYNALRSLVASSNTAGMIIPTLLIILGIGFVYLQIQPQIQTKVGEVVGANAQGTISLVQESYIQNKLQYVSNPGADYFRELSEAAFASGVAVRDEQSANYSGTFYISIPRLGIDRMPVESNVDSGNSDIYRNALLTQLAHFEGSSLPFADNPGNIVIYGHSVGGGYAARPNDPVSAFSFLRDLQVGDEIAIEMEGVVHKYRMRKSDVVEPHDTSILTSRPGREELTLFTCYPPGNRSNRLVVKATPV